MRISVEFKTRKIAIVRNARSKCTILIDGFGRYDLLTCLGRFARAYITLVELSNGRVGCLERKIEHEEKKLPLHKNDHSKEGVSRRAGFFQVVADSLCVTSESKPRKARSRSKCQSY
ncbi:hypothetical protein HJC23_006635 [Cyclotella cryptica]|uniref:LAGLIDADG homing endonuclease n=1 Tax=Cyclotella cryptica TaxID=29204 RepID=A0ABD3QXB6_9STRA